jgi:signal peptidase I
VGILRNDTSPPPKDDMYLNDTTHITARRGFAGRVAGFLWELIQTVLLTLLIFFAMRAVVQNFKVEGTSMEPTLHNNQFLIINKVTYARIDGTPVERLLPTAPEIAGSPRFLFGDPERGDIIVFRFPAQPDKDFIKRIIGVPGDLIEVKAGRVYLNGQLQDEQYIKDGASYDRQAQVVPQGQYFVLGDNRPNSSDSHVWGFVPADNLVGKAWFAYWPPSDWGPLATGALAH